MPHRTCVLPADSLLVGTGSLAAVCADTDVGAEIWIAVCADADGKKVKSQLLPISNATQDLQQAMLAADILPSLRSAASHELAFIALVPPLGYATYTISAERNSAHPEQEDSAELSTTRSMRSTL